VGFKLGWVLLAAGAMVTGAALLGGCNRTFTGQAVQPNPLAQAGISLRESVPIVIVTGDKDLPKVPTTTGSPGGAVWVDYEPYPLRNVASFTVVSRDRLRFHVHLEHKWEEYADPTNWDAYLVIDRGAPHQPEGVDARPGGHVSKMWDYEQRSVVRNRYRDIIFVNNDGYKRRVPLYSMTLFQGDGDFVFYSRDIFTPDVKSVRLVLKHRATAFEFTWRFDEGREIDARGAATRAALGPAGS
jgi:hypothetical protein